MDHLQLIAFTALFATTVSSALAFDGEKDVDLRLYTLKNPTTPEHLTTSNDAASGSFNPNNPTRFLVHGWVSSEERVAPIRNAYIAAGLDYNIVVVDWSGPASESYASAKNSSKLVGEYLAQVIEHLVAARGLNLDNVYLIGHSLGAHISGVAGNRLNGQVAQIIGLDAAAPLFWFAAREDRLDSTDGKVVQCIHSNGGMQGWGLPLGHMDFYPNGGTRQPGCGTDLNGGCSHNKAPILFAESITSKNMVGTKCGNYLAYQMGRCKSNAQSPMGEWAPLTTTGTYYLNTNSTASGDKIDTTH